MSFYACTKHLNRVVGNMREEFLWPYLMGIDTGHELSFVYDRPPDPRGKALLMCFRSPAEILTANGMEIAKPGDCVIHSPTMRNYHRGVAGAKQGFRNDWLHADYDMTIYAMNRLKLPWNKLINSGKPNILEPFIRTFETELALGDEFSLAAIQNGFFSALLAILRTARENIRKREILSAREQQYYEKFNRLRERTLECYPDKHTVERLARQVSLSPERFSVLYRKFFNSSPISDIIDARISAAKKLLVCSTKPIQEIAIECGFDDLYYFSRIFKRRTSYSPTAFREKN